MTTFVLGSSSYAIVTGSNGNRVQLIDVSDPQTITAPAMYYCSTTPDAVKVFDIGGTYYAIVAARWYGVKLHQLTD